MSITATIDIGNRSITGQFETLLHNGQEYAIVSQTDTGDPIGIPLDKANIEQIDPSFGLAVPRFHRGKLSLEDGIAIPKQE